MSGEILAPDYEPKQMAALPVADDGKEIRLADGYRIVRLSPLPGFDVFKGRRHIKRVPFWTEAVSVVLVEREAALVEGPPITDDD